MLKQLGIDRNQLPKGLSGRLWLPPSEHGGNRFTPRFNSSMPSSPPVLTRDRAYRSGVEAESQGETEEDEPDQDQGDHLCDPIPEETVAVAPDHRQRSHREHDVHPVIIPVEGVKGIVQGRVLGQHLGLQLGLRGTV